MWIVAEWTIGIEGSEPGQGIFSIHQLFWRVAELKDRAMFVAHSSHIPGELPVITYDSSHIPGELPFTTYDSSHIPGELPVIT